MGREHLKDINKVGVIEKGGLVFQVRILDAKQSYGRTRWLVTPLAGSGQEWTERVQIKE